MNTPLEYRTRARVALQNHWIEAAVVSAIILMLSSMCSIPSALDSLAELAEVELVGSIWWTIFVTPILSMLSLLIVPIQYAFYITLLDCTRNSSTNIIDGTWERSKKSYAKLLVAGVVITVAIVLVGLVTLGIGAIVLSYAYRMVPYLLADYPELSIREAMKVSREMTRGYKWRLVLLDLSFIGWLLLCVVTLGMATLFVAPYMNTAVALFYEDLKNLRLVHTED